MTLRGLIWENVLDKYNYNLPGKVTCKVEYELL